MPREIPLTRGLFAIVDDEDFERLSKWKWHANLQSSRFYAARTLKKILMHNVVLGHAQNRKIVVDHINRNSLDNRKCNLRLVTQSENLLNHKRKQDGIVYRGDFPKPWRLRIRIGKYKRKHIGIYATRQEAEEALHAYTNS
jgi:hypothetical protein